MKHKLPRVPHSSQEEGQSKPTIKSSIGQDDGRPHRRLHHAPAAAPRLAMAPAPRVRLRPLRAPLQGRLLHLLAHPRRYVHDGSIASSSFSSNSPAVDSDCCGMARCRWLLRVRHRGRLLQRRLPRRRQPRAVPRRRRRRRLLPGPVPATAAATATFTNQITSQAGADRALDSQSVAPVLCCAVLCVSP